MKQTLLCPYSKHVKAINIFSISVLVMTCVYWIVNITTHGAYINMYFITDHQDTAMDYFNMLANLNREDPWDAQANYPAICFLLWKFMHQMLPLGEFPDGFSLRQDMVAQLGYILFVLVCLVIVWETIKYCAKGTRAEKTLFACALLFSGPMTYLLERGNILLAALAFSLLFLAFYDSEKLLLRILSYGCLAIAAAIKIYPAVLGLLVLWKKRYKEAFILLLIGMATFLIPFFAFEGIESLKKMLSGIEYAASIHANLGFGLNFSVSNLTKMVFAFFGHNLTSVPDWIPVAAACCCFMLFFLCQHEWQKLYALISLCIWFPGFSYTYTLVLLFLPIISFFFRSARQQQGRFKYVYAVTFALMILPYVLPMADKVNAVLEREFIKYPLSWGTIIVNFLLVGTAMLLLLEAILDRITLFNKKQEIRGNNNE